MKSTLITISMLAVLALAACTNGGSWTPMSGGRTAGDAQVVQQPAPAEQAVSKSLQK
jgi:hypothetical protein